MKRVNTAIPAPVPENPPLGGVLDFLRLLWALDHGLQTGSRKMESRLGVTGPQRMVVRIVGRFPGISAGELAQVLHVHPSTLTGVLKRLENRNLITRTPDPTDGRRARFALTDSGLTLDAAKHGTVESKVKTALSTVPPAKLRTAQEVLRMLVDGLAREEETGS
jgi:DNA-binding MarR family transcriptional regulator